MLFDKRNLQDFILNDVSNGRTKRWIDISIYRVASLLIRTLDPKLQTLFIFKDMPQTAISIITFIYLFS